MSSTKKTNRPNGAAKVKENGVHAAPNDNERPAKKAKLLDESDDSEVEFEEQDDIKLNINEEYARRFEHNKKREERHRLEEKYGKDLTTSKKVRQDEDGSTNENSDESSSDETEDEDGFLITEGADSEFQATLSALKNKDPKIYDSTTRFYTQKDEEDEDNQNSEHISGKKEKPMTLRDYHRKNLLEGNTQPTESEQDPPQTYAQEQEELKQNLIAQMHADADADDEKLQDSDDDGFLVRKSLPEKPTAGIQLSEVDVATADKDPESFLSKFLASRAWKPEDNSRFAPMDSDDSDEDNRADAFEEAYNMRFENPSLSNTNIITHSRSAVSKYTVRRDETNPRKRAREKEREKKDAEKAERDAEKAQLKRLRMEEMEAKVAKIKEAAGLIGKTTDITDWSELLEQDWDDNRWAKEFEKKFGTSYYANTGETSDGSTGGSKKKVKKPKWDDDIDIKDLVPDFSDDSHPSIQGSDDEEEEAAINEAYGADNAQDPTSEKTKSKKDRLAERAEKKKASRRDRRLIEQMVENTLPTDAELAATKKSKTHVPFRYRETSPTSFGLTTLDILSASDAQLNQFVGLKKLTPFRDPERKSKERKKISKKGRLREWRKELYGTQNDDITFQKSDQQITGETSEKQESKKKRKKRKGAKSKDEKIADAV